MRIQQVVVASALVTVGLATSAYAQVVPPPPVPVVAPLVAPVAAPIVIANVSGAYTGTWGPMTLEQAGTHVIGAYTYNGGQIDGTFDGQTLRFTWQESSGAAGHAMMMRDASGGLSGTWGSGGSESDGGPWQLTPMSQAANLGIDAASMQARLVEQQARLVALTQAQAPAAADTSTDGPHAGAMSLSLALPIDAMFGKSTLMGVAGLDVGLGRRLTDSWYVGAVGQYERVIELADTDDAPSPSSRVRIGAEARYIFNHGTGSASVNCGPSFAVPRTDWIGARLGAETFDGFSTIGTFGELELGTDWWLGQTQIGVYMSAGFSVQKTGVIAPAAPNSGADAGQPLTGTADQMSAPADPNGNSTSTYVTFGWRVAFG